MKKRFTLIVTGLFALWVSSLWATDEASPSVSADGNNIVELSVPFMAQPASKDAASHGAAALAMMLAASDSHSPTVEELAIKWPRDKTDTRITLANMARLQGYVPYPVANLAAILAALAQGFPVLVTERASKKSPLNFSVISGHNQQTKELYWHTAQQAHSPISLQAFERRWAAADRWAVLILKPSSLPETLEPAVVVKELFGMAQQGELAAAQAGLARSVLNWPSYKAAWVGLASVAEQNHQPALAESALRELVRRQPNYGPGLNNLADFLYRTHREKEALEYAERAVAVLDIPQTRALLATLHRALQGQAPVSESEQNAVTEP